MGRPVPAAQPRESGDLVTDATLVLGDAQSAPLVASMVVARPDLEVCIELDRSGALTPPDAGQQQIQAAAAPHVVMMVANDISRDTRVRKSALAVAAAGVRVTVVGYAPDGRRHETRLGPVTLNVIRSLSAAVFSPSGARDAAPRRRHMAYRIAESVALVLE